MEEQMQSNFNFDSHSSTNQDLTIVFTPDESVKHYSYSLFNENELIDSNIIEKNEPVSIVLTETGIYQIKINTYDAENKKNVIESGIYEIDKEAPIIELSNEVLKLRAGEEFSLKDGVKAYDSQDGDLLDKITTNIAELDLNETGIKKLIYKVEDNAGNITTKSLILNVIKNNTSTLIFFQIGLIFIIIGTIFGVLSYRKNSKLEEKIRKYSLEPIEDTSLSLFDKYYESYTHALKVISKSIQKSVFLKRYSKRYEKYVGIFGDISRTGIDFVSAKIIMSCLFVVVTIFSSTIQLRVTSLYEIIFPFLVGFFSPDILYIAKYKVHRKHIENDLLQAIIIMNNAFKSGRSITQAIDLVGAELDGAIAKEFRKMSSELSFGLSVDVVFERFAERIELEEVNYLTASLSILNRTGGNIIKVFSSIEESLFSKKKLWLELESLTSSSKLIMYVLFCVPIAFVIFVSVINPDYFLPFIESPIGIILLIIIILLYVFYIICVRKIMKVRM